ncbi:SLC13 family permease [Tenuibacillus multivorans]|uniref:Di-and tricarboxylate transporter n=1 Tax=Tenuibacillus multivorans TaxID=237069 RepID=A0A1H0BUA6_9BACI|nr:SLC13 family permease [Tenuibacillus multivorans]GEL77033.1 sodium:sulfate symporter [Tenuibacillus multivorans]SDN49173.1 Di-and tricarboxylate transporter [Tenuibacillus multivorans]
MTFEMGFVLILIFVMLASLILEVARPEMVMFTALTVLLVTGILTPGEALRGFSNEGMVTLALLFMVAGAIQKHGVIDSIVHKLLRKVNSFQGITMRLFAPIAVFSSFFNNTPLVVALTPVLRNWCEEKGIAPSKLLIPLSYVTILGGTVTLIGTSTNLVVHGMLVERGLGGFSFFQMAVVGVPITVLGLVYIAVVGHRLLPSYKSFTEKVWEDSREYMAELTVRGDFPYLYQTVQEAGLRDLKGLYLIEIIRKKEMVSPVRSTTVIQAGDRLIFTGMISTIAELQRMKGLELETGTDIDPNDLKGGSTQLVEAVVSHESPLCSRSIKQLQFRAKYDAGVVAVHRNHERVERKVGDIVLEPGDTLLLLAGPDFIEKHRVSSDFYVVSELNPPTAFNASPKRGWFALGVLLTMVLLVTLGVLSMLKAMMIAALTLLFTKVIELEEAKKFLHFNIMLLIASAIGIGTAMSKTGLAAWLAERALMLVEPFGVVAVIALVYILTNLFTEVITNVASAVLMVPIGLEVAEVIGVDPMGIAVTIAIAASASFVTPIGYQTNLIVYGPGGYKFTDYFKVGFPLSVLVMVVTVVVVNYILY